MSDKMITIFNVFFAISAVSSASIISLDIERTRVKANILLDSYPFNFSKSTLTTKKPTSSPSDYTYLLTKSASTSEKSTDSTVRDSNSYVSTSETTGIIFPTLYPSKTTYTTVMPSVSTDRYSSSSKTSLIPTPKPIKKPKSCAELFLQGNKTSGVYTIYPPIMYETNPFQVYCDMQTNGGGWTAFQRRDDYKPRENFTRNWHDYKVGFGNLEREFWLGNDYLFILTNQDDVELRIELHDFKGNKTWVQYSQFEIQDENYSYNLSISGHAGTDGDSLSYLKNQVFSTYDRDNKWSCAKLCKGGWWYNDCAYAKLNGIYFQENRENYNEGITWYYSKGYDVLKKTEMKLRPINF